MDGWLERQKAIGGSYNYHLLSGYCVLHTTYFSYLFLIASLQGHLYYSHFTDRKVQLSDLPKSTLSESDSTGI